MIKATEQTHSNFLWREIASPKEMSKLSKRAMRQFLADFTAGTREGRYVVAALPALPFRRRQFGIALCSHFLFTSRSAMSQEFHFAAIQEMCRVAGGARVFRLLHSFGNQKSAHLEPIVKQLTNSRYICEVKTVAYEFQRGANEMLCVQRSS